MSAAESTQEEMEQIDGGLVAEDYDLEETEEANEISTETDEEIDEVESYNETVIEATEDDEESRLFNETFVDALEDYSDNDLLEENIVEEAEDADSETVDDIIGEEELVDDEDLLVGLLEDNSGVCGENLTWVLDDEGTLTVSGTGAMYDYNYGWSSSESELISPFRELYEKVVNVVIEEGVTSVGDGAFYCCHLKSAVLPSTVTTIGAGAFSNCGYLTKIEMPSTGVKEIGEYAFYEDKSLESIVLPDSLNKIEYYAFEGCISLSSINIPAGLTEFEWAFLRCLNLESFEVAEANSNFISVDGVLFDKKMEKLLGYPVGKKNTSYSIPEGVQEIKIDQFNANTNIISLLIPSSVNNLDSNSYVNTRSNIDGRIYDSSLSSITIDDRNAYISSYNGTVYDNTYNTLICCPAGRETCNINSLTQVIGTRAFENCTKIQEIILPDSVEKIEEDAFRYCTKLEKVSFGKNVKTIGDQAFFGCHSFKNIELPETLDSLGYEVFGTNGLYTIDRLVFHNVSNKITYSVFFNAKVSDIIFKGHNPFDWSDYCSLGDADTVYYPARYYNEYSALYWWQKAGNFTIIALDDDGNPIDINDYYPQAKNVSYIAKYNKADLTLSYNENDFKVSSTLYNHSLAQFAIGLSTLAYSTNKNMYNALDGLGYANIESFEDDDGRTISFWISHKKIMLGQEKTELVNITLRGTYKREWVDNFDPGYSDTHQGFERAANHVIECLKKYIKENDYFGKEAKIKILITGHSRGAAVANLIGYMLDKDGDIGTEYNPQKDDIFVYTFATPNVTRSPNALSDTNYNNIYNVVNPEDFVTKVPLSWWGYRRYGTTFILPSSTTDVGKNGNYVDYYNWYQNYLAAEYCKLKPKGSAYKPYPDGMAPLMHYISYVNKKISNINMYYDEDIGIPGNTLQNLYQNALGKFKSGYSIDKLDAYNCWADAISLYYGFIGIKTISFFISHQAIIPEFQWAHEAETYYAAMSILTKEQLTVNRNFIKGMVNCPVDVTIRDEDGNVVGRIVNNGIDETINGHISMIIDGDSKEFYLPALNKYSVELSGSDNGTMDYSVATFNEDNEESRTYFGNVPVAKSKSFVQEIGPSIDINSEPLHDENGGTIFPDAVISQNQMGTFNVKVNVEGPGSADELHSLTLGDYVTVIAVPNDGCSFEGWFNEVGEKLSSEEEYSFSIKGDTSLKAIFKGHDAGTTPQDQNTNGNSNNGNGAKENVDISKANITGIKDVEYTGSSITQHVTIAINGKVLINNTDYSVTYQNNKEIGTATVIVKGKDKYTGVLTATFSINPKGVKFSKVTSGKKKVEMKWKKNKTVTGYQIQYSLKSSFNNAKTITIKKQKITSKVVKKLKSNKKYYFRIRTYKTVNGKKYYSTWSKKKKVKTK